MKLILFALTASGVWAQAFRPENPKTWDEEKLRLQILPLAGTCDTAQRVIETGGKAAGLLLNARIMLDGAGKRLILLPGFANTCIAISVESHFSPP